MDCPCALECKRDRLRSIEKRPKGLLVSNVMLGRAVCVGVANRDSRCGGTRFVGENVVLYVGCIHFKSDVTGRARNIPLLVYNGSLSASNVTPPQYIKTYKSEDIYSSSRKDLCVSETLRTFEATQRRSLEWALIVSRQALSHHKIRLASCTQQSYSRRLRRQPQR